MFIEDPRRDQELLEQALEAFTRTTRLATRVIAREVPNDRGLGRFVIGAIVEIEANHVKHQFTAEIKFVDRFETLINLKAQGERARNPLVIIAPYIATRTAQKCRELDLCFIDTAGNAFINTPGLFIFVTGNRHFEAPLQTNIRTNNAAALKIMFAILCRPELVKATYRELARVAGTALGTVGPVIKNLARRRFVTTGLTEKRHLLEPWKMLEEWIAFYPAVLRPKLKPRRFRATEKGWQQRVPLQAFNAFWGGEVAAEILTHYLRPEIFTIYTHRNPAKLIAECRFRADINGDIEILEAFWNEGEIPTPKVDVVPPILAYADLMTTTHGRNLEAAKLLYDRFIEQNIPAQRY